MAVNVTSKVFGVTATWNGYTAEVKYKDMPGVAKLGDKKFNLDKWTLEYKDKDFPGLKEKVDILKKEPISVVVRGETVHFIAVEADALSDGLCVELKLRKKP